MNTTTEASYDGIADWYDEVQQSGTVVQDAAILALNILSGAVEKQRILDLACGQGIVARAFGRRGALVTGVDISAKLLEIARRLERENPLGIEYYQDNAESLKLLPPAMFDGVFCNMALMDIADL